MVNCNRRDLLRRALMGALSLGLMPAGRLAADLCLPVTGRDSLALPPGPLAAVGPLQGPNALGVALPEGFGLRQLARAGRQVETPGASSSHSDYRWHNFPDGGAVFARADGGWVYTSNAEIPLLPLGGCGALSFNVAGEVDEAYSLLSGTTRNCAGGASPWNTWISCEETREGLCWECDPYQPGQGVAKPALGRFAHEAVAFDRRRHCVYLTEDRPDGRFYRWVAAEADVMPDGRLALEKGQLEVMNIAGYGDGCYPRSAALLQRQLPVSWQPVEQPDASQESVRATLATAGRPAPGTVFAGGEGLWTYELPSALARSLQTASASHQPDTLIFWSTKLDNRIWMLDVANQLVELVYDNSSIEPPLRDVDNLTVSPWGDLLVAEDPFTGDSARLMVVLPKRGAIPLLAIYHGGSEICGPAFSPDGSRLYFSSQRAGLRGATYELQIPARYTSG